VRRRGFNAGSGPAESPSAVAFPRPVAAATLANGEPFLAAGAVKLLPVDLDALALQQDA
jgi:hypothetical protein